MEIQDDNTYKILLCEWSDGFDPNGMNKNNRRSSHVTSFSIFGKDSRNDPHLSFPATATNDKSNKIELRKKIYDDLKKLREPTRFFNGKQFIFVQVIVFLTIQDRKERS